MEKEKRIKFLFTGSAVCFAVMSLSIWLLLAPGEEGITPAGIAMGILFWAGLLGGIGCYIPLWKKEKELKKSGRKIPGLHFFRNVPGIAGELIFLAGIAGLAAGSRLAVRNELLDIVSLFGIVTGIWGHFLFNGNIFQFHIWKKRNLGGEEK